MKPRRSSKPRHKFKFTVKVHHIIFPKAIARKLSSSKFYCILSRADKNSQTKIGSISKNGKIEYNQEISIQATLFKNRSSNTFISKHCRIVLRQLKNSNNSTTKARESSVGSIKIDLIDYIDRIPTEEKIGFTKCALEDVYIICTIRAQEIAIEASNYDDNMSVTSANTIRVDSFWLDTEEQKSVSSINNHHHREDSISNNHHKINGHHHHERTESRNHSEFYSEGITDNEEPEPEGKHFDDQISDSQRKLRLTDKHLAKFNGKQKDMAKFRIKHAMDVMANENNYFDDLYAMYEKEKKELHGARDKIDRLEKRVKEKEIEIGHFYEEERKWNKCMVEWQREKSNFEASTIELNYKYQQEKQSHKQCKQQLSEIELSTKKILLDKQKMEEKYAKLVQSLGKDRNPLLAQISHLQMEYDDLEESLIQQQNSWRETGNILEHELEKQKRKTIKCMNELKKYKQRYERYKSENAGLYSKLEMLQKEVFQMKSQHEINMAQIKFESNKKLVASTNLINKLMITSQQNQQLQNLVCELVENGNNHSNNGNDNNLYNNHVYNDKDLIDVVNDSDVNKEIQEPQPQEAQDEEPEIEFYDDDDIEDNDGKSDHEVSDHKQVQQTQETQETQKTEKKSKSKSRRNKLSSSSIISNKSNSSSSSISTLNGPVQNIASVKSQIAKFNSKSKDEPKLKKKRRGCKVRRNSKQTLPKPSSSNLSDKENQKQKTKKRKRNKSNGYKKDELLSSGPILRKSPPRVSSVRSLMKKVEKEENELIEQELLSPVVADDDDDGEENVENEEMVENVMMHDIIMTDMNHLGNISNILIQEMENGVSSLSDDQQDEERREHRHVRSDESINLAVLNDAESKLHPQNLGIDLDDFNAMDNERHINLSDDDISDLSESGSPDQQQMTKPEVVEDID